MDPRTKVSPLLSPRPEFLGVGWGRQRANIFIELFSISFIYPFISTLTSPDNQGSRLSDLDQFHNEARIDKPNVVTSANENASESKHGSHETKYTLCDYEQTVDLRRKETHHECVKYDHFDLREETEDVFKIFRQLKIPFETEVYKPKEDRIHMDKNKFYCKNLFLKDRRGQFYLIIFHEDTDMNLKQLRKTLNAYRSFNFATADDMRRILHCEPGGVTPLALMYESAREVTMVVSESLVNDEAQLMFHPMDAKLATKISLPCLLRFLKHFGCAVRFID